MEEGGAGRVLHRKRLGEGCWEGWVGEGRPA